MPINGPIDAKAAAQIDRGKAADTLNFRLPGWLCTGQVYFAVRVFDAARGDVLAFSSPTASLSPRFEEIADPNRLRLTVVRIIYTGPDRGDGPRL